MYLSKLLYSWFVSRMPRLRSLDGQSPVQDPGEPLYHYIVLRRDLPFGVQIAQTTHAAGESARLGDLPANTHAVVLGVPDLPALEALEQKLQTQGIKHRSIREPDEPYSGALMAIGLQPQARSKPLRRLLGGFPLIK